MSQGSLRLGLCAGEASGDLLAGAMLRAWQQRGTSLDITGIGGDQMQAAGLESLCAIDRLAVMGLVEPLKRLPELLGIRRRLIAQQQQVAPDLFVGVDSPDFITATGTAADLFDESVSHSASVRRWSVDR